MSLFVFLFYLSAGLVAALAVVRLGAEGKNFFLFNGAIAWILGVTALVLRSLAADRWGWGPGLGPSPLVIASATTGLALLAIYLVVGSLRTELRALLRTSAGLLTAAVVLDAIALHSGPAAGPLPAGTPLHVVNALTSAWLAGSFLLAMVLGHFYLVIPKLSIAPLRSLFRLSLIGLVVRILLVAIVGGLWWSAGGSASLTVAGFLGRGVFVLQRLLFGLLIPASLAYFTWKTIEMRSTQSATGILYVVVFLTLVGEALSVYLSLETTFPI